MTIYCSYFLRRQGNDNGVTRKQDIFRCMYGAVFADRGSRDTREPQIVLKRSDHGETQQIINGTIYVYGLPKSKAFLLYDEKLLSKGYLFHAFAH